MVNLTWFYTFLRFEILQEWLAETGHKRQLDGLVVSGQSKHKHEKWAATERTWWQMYNNCYNLLALEPVISCLWSITMYLELPPDTPQMK